MDIFAPSASIMLVAAITLMFLGDYLLCHKGK